MADPLGIPLDQLVVGRTYRVDLDDCCIEGHFTDTFLAIHRDEDGDLEEVEFARAQMTRPWSFGGSWWITDPDEDSEPGTLDAESQVPGEQPPGPWAPARHGEKLPHPQPQEQSAERLDLTGRDPATITPIELLAFAYPDVHALMKERDALQLEVRLLQAALLDQPERPDHA